MKKTFSLRSANNGDERVLEAVKGEIRKYLKRERRKPYPESFNRWEFACKVGAELASAESTPVDDVIPAIDAVAKKGAAQVYVEILAVASLRAMPPADVDAPPGVM